MKGKVWPLMFFFLTSGWIFFIFFQGEGNKLSEPVPENASKVPQDISKKTSNKTSRLTEPITQVMTIRGEMETYQIQRYEPPLWIETVTKEQATYKTPEETLRSLYSAGQAGDTQWLLACYSKGSREIASTKAPGDMIILNIAGNMVTLNTFSDPIRLTHKIHYDKFFILAFNKVMKEDPYRFNDMYLPVIFIREDDKYLVDLHSPLKNPETDEEILEHLWPEYPENEAAPWKNDE